MFQHLVPIKKFDFAPTLLIVSFIILVIRKNFQTSSKSHFSRNRGIYLAGSCFFFDCIFDFGPFCIFSGIFLPIQKCKRLEIWRSYSSRHPTGTSNFSSRYFMKKPIFLPFLLILIFFLKKKCHLCFKIWTKYFFHDLILNGHLEIDAI